jgi:cytochrome c biogenesis protein CcdA
VSLAVSSGFISLFVIAGVITRLFTRVIQENAKYVSFGLGILLIIGGIAMLAGWKPTFMTPSVNIHKDTTVRAMFAYGIAYAIASIGCTLPLLTTVILGSFTRHGTISGIVSVALYGVGMAMLVSALTVSLAFARTGLVRMARNSLRYMSTISAALVTLTGIYLSLYWWGTIRNSDTSNPVVSTVDRWQSKIVTWLSNLGAIPIAISLGAVLFIAVAVIDIQRANRKNTGE